MKKTFWVLALMLDSNQFAQVSIANLYAVVTLYSSISSVFPYLSKKKWEGSNVEGDLSASLQIRNVLNE